MRCAKSKLNPAWLASSAPHPVSASRQISVPPPAQQARRPGKGEATGYKQVNALVIDAFDAGGNAGLAL